MAKKRKKHRATYRRNRSPYGVKPIDFANLALATAVGVATIGLIKNT